MKKLTLLLVLLFVSTTIGCVTVRETVYVEYILPPVPEREEIQIDGELTKQQLAEILNYYEHLVQQWELWGDSVKEIIEYGR